MDILTYLTQEWEIIQEAPLSFILIFVIGISGGFRFGKLHYDQRIKLLEEKLDFEQKRRESKDDIINDYRERLGLNPTKGNEFSRMSHVELKQWTLNFVRKVRNLSHKNKEDQNKTLRWDVEDSKVEPTKKWAEGCNHLLESSSRFMYEYETKYKIDSILLRDEILSRLPNEVKDRNSLSYEHPTNYIGVDMIADDLERLAKKLA